MKSKLMTMLTAFALVFGILLSPFTSANAAEETPDPSPTVDAGAVVGTIDPDDVQPQEPDQTNLTIHKLVADNYKNGVPLEHNGGILSNDQLAELGTNVRGLAGVTFTYYKVDDEDKFATMVANPTEYATSESVKNLLNVTGTSIRTGADGSATIPLEKGNYWVIETGRPTSVTGSLAVPFGITLPLMNQTQVGNNAPGIVYLNTVHIYPKNLSEKPQMDKGFGKNKDGLDSQMLEDWKETYGPEYSKYLEQKAIIDATVGSTVPYEVKTSLKTGQVYQVLSWSDIMTEGLMYNRDLTLSYIPAGEGATEVPITNFSTRNETDYGFDIVITDKATISAINAALQNGNVEFILKYSATVTRDTVVDLPESNNITFTPGEPKHNNTQQPVTPTNGLITINKNWAVGEVPKNVLVTYILFEVDGANQKPIASVTLLGDTIQSMSLAEGMSVSNDGYNVTFSGLFSDRNYRVEEFANGYDPKYESATGINNILNPDTITPTPPQVVTGGKRFVKTDGSPQDPQRLAGAEFVVKNSEGKYLVAKTDDAIAMSQGTVTTAKQELDDAIKAYNALSKEDQQGAIGGEAKALINEKQEAYNQAVKEAGNIYQRGNKENAIIFVSDGQGRLEVTGLAYGNYLLEEIKAPQGYAKLTEDIPFIVNGNSYYSHSEDGGIPYNEFPPRGEMQLIPTAYAAEQLPSLGTIDYPEAQEVINKSLTIPQTGGIGSLIFIVAGIAIMGIALVMRRRSQYEEQ